MARNKYPERTVEKILDAATKLFLEKGYEQTTIQDIVDALDGLSKGAVYHHFNSKADIIDAVGNRMYAQENPFELAQKQAFSTAYDKLVYAFLYNHKREDVRKIHYDTIPLLADPTLFMRYFQQTFEIVAPEVQTLLEEGVKDGSVPPLDPKLTAELILLLSNVWFNPMFEASAAEYRKKVDYVKMIFQKLGFGSFAEDVIERIFQTLEPVLQQQEEKP